MCERLKQAVLKTAVRETVPGVRIPLPPPLTSLVGRLLSGFYCTTGRIAVQITPNGAHRRAGPWELPFLVGLSKPRRSRRTQGYIPRPAFFQRLTSNSRILVVVVDRARMFLLLTLLVRALWAPTNRRKWQGNRHTLARPRTVFFCQAVFSVQGSVVGAAHLPS
jgi:hypothetical protein